MSDVRITPSATGKRLLLHTPYNAGFVADVKDIGGRWDSGKRAWSVDARDEDRAKQLLIDHYGTDGSPEMSADVVTVRIKLAQHELSYRDGAKATYAGRIIATRPGRDAPVRLSPGVVLIEGELPRSGGSMKYPQISADSDVILEVRDVPRAAAESENGWSEIVSEGTVDTGPDTEALLTRRAELIGQVAELDAKLRELDPEGHAERQQSEKDVLLAQVRAEVEREHRRDKAEAIRALVRDHDAAEAEKQVERDRERAEDERMNEAVKALPIGCRCGKHTCAPQGLSPAAYAKLVGKSSQTVVAWAKKGKVAAVQHGGRWYITETVNG